MEVYFTIMTLPNFVVIGAGKAGTTSLHSYLKQHPEIFLTEKKELNFFAVEDRKFNFSGPRDELEDRNYFSITDIHTYENLFNEVESEKAVGDISPFYIYSEQASERIKFYIPDTKIIAILRNPVDRAYSNYLHLLRDGRESLQSFEDAIQAENERIQSHWSPSWHYAHAGLYYELLKRYYEKFDRDQIHIFLYESYVSNPVNIVNPIYDILDVDRNFLPDFSVKYNSSGIPKNQALHRFLSSKNSIRNWAKNSLPEVVVKKITSFRDGNLDKPPPMSPTTRTNLMSYFRDDILKLQDLIQLDLSEWLQ